MKKCTITHPSLISFWQYDQGHLTHVYIKYFVWESDFNSESSGEAFPHLQFKFSHHYYLFGVKVGLKCDVLDLVIRESENIMVINTHVKETRRRTVVCGESCRPYK